MNKWNYIKLKQFFTANETILRRKRQLTEWEKMFTSDTSHKGLVFKLYKELIPINTKRKINNLILKISTAP